MNWRVTSTHWQQRPLLGANIFCLQSRRWMFPPKDRYFWHMAADREMAFRQENYFHAAARRVRGGQLRAGTGDKCSHIRGGSSGIGNIKYGRGLVTADTMSNKTEDVSVSMCFWRFLNLQFWWSKTVCKIFSTCINHCLNVSVVLLYCLMWLMSCNEPRIGGQCFL